MDISCSAAPSLAGPLAVVLPGAVGVIIHRNHKDRCKIPLRGWIFFLVAILKRKLELQNLVKEY